MFIAFDVARLFIGPLSKTPRGIDRVDLEIAQILFERGDDRCAGVLPTPWGIRLFPAKRVRRGLRYLSEVWAEGRDPEDDPVWRRLRAELLGLPAEAAEAAPSGDGQVRQIARQLGMIGATGFTFGRSAAGRLPRGAVYLNLGQIGLTVPWLFRWLDRRPDVKSVFMLHDVIPITHSEYVSESSARHHKKMLVSTRSHARGLLVTTEDARACIQAQLAEMGCEPLPTLALPLPVPRIFTTPPDREVVERLRQRPYFVMCGAIEPRKNHALMLRVWEDMVAEMGERTPHLVIAGSPAWQGAAIVEAFRRSPTLAPHVSIVHGLSSPALKILVAAARSLLMPSYAEGFGLPIIEALQLGTPVVASDIGCHVEIAADRALLLSPDDAAAWKAAIRAAVTRPAVAPVPVPEWTWEAYYRRLEDFLSGLVAGDASRG